MSTDFVLSGTSPVSSVVFCFAMERESTAGHHEHLQNLCHRIVSHLCLQESDGVILGGFRFPPPKVASFFRDFWGRFFVSLYGIEVKRFTPIKHFTQKAPNRWVGQGRPSHSLPAVTSLRFGWIFRRDQARETHSSWAKNQGWPHHFFGESRYSDQFDLYIVLILSSKIS